MQINDDSQHLASWTPLAVFWGLLGFAIFWLMSVQVTLHEEGIRFQSRFGTKEMRWDEVDTFTYSATKQSVNFIPVGTYYKFKLVNLQGKIIKFTNSVGRAAQLADKIVQQSTPPIFKRCADLYHSGAEVVFGKIRISKAGGIRIKKTIGSAEVALDQVANYRIETGRVFIFKTDEKWQWGTPIEEVPNVFVLLALLDAIYQPEPVAAPR